MGTDKWTPLVSRAGNGLWAPSCIAHTMTWGFWTDSSWEVPAGSGNTMAAVVSGWLEDVDLARSHVFQDSAPWPQNQPCSAWTRASPAAKVHARDAELNI